MMNERHKELVFNSSFIIYHCFLCVLYGKYQIFDLKHPQEGREVFLREVEADLHFVALHADLRVFDCRA